MSLEDYERNPDADRDKGQGAALPEEELEREARERQEQVNQYLSDRYARREVVTQTRTRGGLALDWVPVESQLRGDKLATPPEDDRPIERDPEQRQEVQRFELQHEEAELGPPGTVPLLRTPVDRIRGGGGLNDWLAKGNRAKRRLPADSPNDLALPAKDVHKHVYATQSVTCFGTEGNINAWDPYVEWSNEFSLGQLWLIRGSGNAQQTLEVGHQEYRDLYGDWVPHLFLFYTTNNYTDQGDNKGGYNTDVDGWVQYASTIHPGALSSPLSQFGGTQYIMALKVQLWQRNWWVRVNGTWIGYYPASLYNSTGLATMASRLDWGGEVVDAADHAGTTSTDMGNGHWPYEGWQRCAYMNNMRYQSSTGGGMTDYNGSAASEAPSCYGIDSHMRSGTNWGSYFWWGGSGKNANCP